MCVYYVCITVKIFYIMYIYSCILFYVYIYICVCVCLLFYIYITKLIYTYIICLQSTPKADK